MASDSSALILGDNIFYGQGFSASYKTAAQLKQGARCLPIRLKIRERYGVVEFDSQGRAISLEEKPKFPSRATR